MDKLSQKIAVLKYIQKNGSITPMEALKHIGSFRLGARIFDLKEDGHDIINLNKTGEDRFAKYSLATESVLKPVKPLKEKPTITTDDYEDIKRRYIASSTEGRIKMLRDAQAKTPQNHREFVEIGKQISILSKGSGT